MGVVLLSVERRQAYAVVSEGPKTSANKKGAADERATKFAVSGYPLPRIYNLPNAIAA